MKKLALFKACDLVAKLLFAVAQGGSEIVLVILKGLDLFAQHLGQFDVDCF